jgi:hypothetical protein
MADGVFSGCENLTSVTLPETLEAIAPNAFAYCTSLKSVVIPSSVTNIGYSAFYGCSAMTEIVIPAGVMRMDVQVFGRCSALKKVTMPLEMKCGRYYGRPSISWFDDNYSQTDCYSAPIEEVVFNGGTSIWSGLFEDCQTLKKVTLSEGVEHIGWNSFRNCTSLQNINIPDSVTNISSSVFEGTLLWSGSPDGVVIVDRCMIGFKGNGPMSLRIPETVRLVAASGFRDMVGLKSITFPSNVIVLSNDAFYGCDAVESIDFEGPPPAGIQEAGVPSGVKLRYNAAYSEQWIPILESIGLENASAYVLPKPDGGPYKETVDGVEWTYMVSDGTASVGDVSWSQAPAVPVETIGDIIIPSTLGGRPVIGVKDYAFYECVGLTSVIIPDGVGSIGENAFAFCGALTNVTIPASVRDIKTKAFNDCRSLMNVIIPNAVTNIGNGAFWFCTSFMRVVIPDSVTSIGSQAFSNCEHLEKVIIGSGVTSIGEETFMSCISLQEIKIPDKVTSIDDAAFYYCTAMTNVMVGCSVTSIGRRAFMQCHALRDVFFRGNAPEMGLNVFYSYLNKDCTAYVQPESTGWGVDIPGTWNGIKIEYMTEDPIPELPSTATADEVAAALGGSADAKLAANITDAENYAAYREWSFSVKTADGSAIAGAEAVKNAANAWLSYALDAEKLIANALVEGDVVIDTFENAATDEAFEFTVNVKDIAVGDGALEANIKKVFDIEGVGDLATGTFSADVVEVNAAAAEGGKVKFTVTPKGGESGALGTTRPTRFFFKVKMK